jgi:uncharacterized protein
MRTFLFFILFFVTGIIFSQNNVYDIARKGTVEQLKAFIKKNPNSVDKKNEDGYTPLILACYRGNNEVAKYIVQNGKSNNITSDMGTPLMACAVKGNNEIAAFLLKNKANPNLTDGNGTNALMYAAQFENTVLIKLLLEYKADKTAKNKEGKTAFEYAAFSGNQTNINLLKTN